jgi:hypothetical protein
MARGFHDIDAELAALRREEKALRAEAAAESRWWAITGQLRNTVLILHKLAQGDMEPALAYLDGVARQRRWPQQPREETIRLIEEVFLGATDTDDALEHYAALTDASHPLDAVSMKVALRRIADWRVVMWSRDLNERIGLAPSSDNMLQRLEAIRSTMPEGHRPASRGTSLAGGSRRWASRLRNRFNGRFGKLKVREVVPPEELMAKARAVWQWYNHLEANVPAGKALLRINLDETSVCAFQGGVAGNIFSTKRRLLEPIESASLGKRRRCLTHVALICDRPDLQPLMPQYLIGNESTFLVGELAALRAACPPNVKIIRQKSAWNNSLLTARIVRELKAVLVPHMTQLQPVLLLDTAKIHLTHALWACKRADIWPMLCPPKTTWMLQPLDTGSFALFKYVLRMAYQRARIASAGGDVSTEALVRCICEAIRKVLQGHRWLDTFEGNGFGQQQQALSPRVCLQLALTSGVHMPSTRPSVDQIQICFPRRTKVPFRALWGAVDGPIAGAVRGAMHGRGRGAARGAAALGGAASPAFAAAGAAGVRARGRGVGLSRTRSGLVYKAD